MDTQTSWILLTLGRILLGGLFVFGGVHHFFILDLLTEVLRKRGVPMPWLVLIAGSIFQLVAGLLLMLGLFVAPTALGLIIFTLAASVMMCNFWNMSGAERDAMQNVWLSNLAIIGGLLIAASQATN